MEHTIDAKHKKLGRLASEIATILQGKKNVSYAPNKVSDDRVHIKNVRLIALSGKKTSQKIYYRHSGPLGHLQKRKYRDVFAKKPGWVLRHAVNAMLPKNRLRAKRLQNLDIEL